MRCSARLSGCCTDGKKKGKLVNLAVNLSGWSIENAAFVEFTESGPVQASLQAISSRKLVTVDVADAIVATDDEALITTLLSNKSVQIREETLYRQFVIDAVALLGETGSAAVRKAFSLASAKGVAAMAWKAGLSAELAHQLQLRLAKVAPSKAIKPSGGRYSLSEKDLDWQVEFFGG